jgi:glycosyltransferase involved in cell wall biosynthesis
VLSVAADGAPLLGRRTGVGVAVAGFLSAVAGQEQIALTIYALSLLGARDLAPAVPAGVHIRRRPMPASLLLRVWSKACWPRAETWTGAVDVVHGTNFVVPPTRRAARLVSVWDLTPVLHPEWCTPASRRYPAVIRRAVDGGAEVHTGSATVAAQVVEHLGADPGRVHVVFPGVSLPAGPARPGRYILGLGTVEPRKNFPGLVAAFDHLADELPDLALVIAGPPGWGSDALDRAVANSSHRDRIRVTGWVEDSGSLLAGAAVLAYPSLYEGFGFPPLEAMAAGVPVVASATGSLPEVLGDAALFVDPADPAAVADSARRAALVEAGRRRASVFDWAEAGRRLAGVYREVAARAER